MCTWVHVENQSICCWVIKPDAVDCRRCLNNHTTKNFDGTWYNTTMSVPETNKSFFTIFFHLENFDLLFHVPRGTYFNCCSTYSLLSKFSALISIFFFFITTHAFVLVWILYFFQSSTCFLTICIQRQRVLILLNSIIMLIEFVIGIT